MNLANAFGYFWSPCLQQLSILGEELDLNRLRRTGESANHVLQHLNKFHPHSRLLRRDQGTHIGNDIIDVAAAIFLQLDQDIAAVGFRDCGQAELQTGASRSALHLRHGFQDFFHVGHYAVSLRQRRPRWGEVIQGEAALIQCRHEV